MNQTNHFKICIIIYFIPNLILLHYKKKFFQKNNFFHNKFFHLFSKKIMEFYKKYNSVNINKIESMLNKNEPLPINIGINNEINLGFHIDKNYVLRSMITLTSIMDSQKNETKIRFHIAVVDVDVEKMIKIYSLRYRIREDVEFNFYNAKKIEIDLNELNTKGPGLNARLIIP